MKNGNCKVELQAALALITYIKATPAHDFGLCAWLDDADMNLQLTDTHLEMRPYHMVYVARNLARALLKLLEAGRLTFNGKFWLVDGERCRGAD